MLLIQYNQLTIIIKQAIVKRSTYGKYVGTCMNPKAQGYLRLIIQIQF